jgi:protein O-mannosyl-transferase
MVKKRNARLTPKPAGPDAGAARPARLDLWIILALVAATLAAYGQVLGHEFTTYDDHLYVTQNEHVQSGLTARSLAWALTSGQDANWLPLTRISHILDFELYGLNAGGQLFTNVLLHALAVALLFLFLRKTTRAPWPSAFVAFLFALHPLHVESVAWISERKDVLCAVFWCATMLAYARYARRPGVRAYLLVAVALTAALASKPMAVTLPFVLLLVDVWPLERWRERRWGALALEKAPLLALSVAASVITFLVQQSAGAVAPLEIAPFPVRLGNAALSYATYLVQTIWPVNLAVFYPLATVPVWEAAAAGIFLAAATALAVSCLRSRPYLTVGWFWYLGTLVPVIGLVQVGFQAHADRYTYLPLVGIFIALAWGARELVAERFRGALMPAGAAICAVCLAVTCVQAGYWRNSETLYRRALEATSSNYWAFNSLAAHVAANGRPAEAVPLLEQALQISPEFADAHYNLGCALAALGRSAEAVPHFEAAVRLKPGHADARFNLGTALADQNRLPEAIDAFSAAARLKPGYAKAHLGWGNALAQSGRWDEAIAQFNEALRIQPDFMEAQRNLELARELRGQAGK